MFKKWLFRVAALIALSTLFVAPVSRAATAGHFNIVEMRQNGDDVTLYLARFQEDWTVDTRTYSAGQYLLTMDGEPQPIDSAQSLRQSEGKIHYILLVDISGSISKRSSNGNPAESDAINQALKRFYGNMQANEVATLIPFGNSGANIAAREQTGAQLSNLPDLEFRDNYTHMFEAIVTGANIYADNPQKYDRTVMVMITDGTDDYTNSNTSMESADHWTFEQARDKLSAANVPFYALMFKRDKGNQDQVVTLANATNGASLVTDTAHLGEKLTSLESIARNSTVLTVSLQQDPEAPKARVIATSFEVSIDADAGEKTPERLFDVDWSKVTAVGEIPDTQLDRFYVRDITEDDDEIRVTTEPGATVVFSQNNQELIRLTADDNGSAVWHLTGRFNPGEEIRVWAQDSKGNDNLPEDQKSLNCENPYTLVVSASPRAPITVTLPKALVDSGYEAFGASLGMVVNGQPGQAVEITWSADQVPERVFTRQLQNNGALSLKLNFEELNGPEVDTVTGGNVVVRYADGLGLSCAGASEGSITWHAQAPEVQDTAIEVPQPMGSLSEDSERWTLQTEAGAQVRVQWDGSRGDQQTAGEDGRVQFDVPAGLREGQEVTVTAVDAAGNRAAPLSVSVGRSTRDAISIDPIASPVMEDTLQIHGRAMPGQTVAVTWTPADPTAQEVTRTAQVNEQGIYATAFSWAECPHGQGYLTASYADGRAYSRHVQLSAVEWAGPTAAPTLTPTPVPTPTLSPTPAPTEAVPEETAEPETPSGLSGLIARVAGNGPALLRNPILWIAAAALLVLLILILLLLRRRRRRNRIQSINSDLPRRDPRLRDNPTVRRGSDPAQDDSAGRTVPRPDPSADRGGTREMDRESLSTGTVRMGQSPASDTGTVRLDRTPVMQLRFEEHSQGTSQFRERIVGIDRVITVGRGDRVNLKIDDNAVSSSHLTIRREGDGLTILDNGSTNGTLLNGQPLERRQPRPLQEGDRIEIGQTTLILRRGGAQ